MAEIKLKRGKISEFQGDAIIIPSDVNLTNKKANDALRSVIERGGNNLLTEISSIGTCEVGCAVITKGYELSVNHVIFIPYIDIDYETRQLSNVILHKSLKSAFNLASLYKVQDVAIEILPLKTRKQNFLERIFSKLFGYGKTEILSGDEIMDVVTGIAEEHKKTVKSITIYK